MEKVKIILDTDIGDDVDDSFALALALKSPEIELIGVTTVYKNCAQRAKIVKAELAAFGREDIPVYAGQDAALCGLWSQFPYEKTCKDGKPYLTAYDEGMTVEADGNDAAGFILDMAEKYPNEIVLVAIGPFTNLAVAYQRDPEKFKKLKKVFLMGGSAGNIREWNILCDPEAAQIVVKIDVPIQIVTLDCTHRCEMKQKYLDALEHLHGKEGEFLRKMFACWKANNTRISQMHDALVVAETYRTFCSYEKRNVFVPVEQELRGYMISTVENYGNLPVLDVAVSVDGDELMDHLFKRLS